MVGALLISDIQGTVDIDDSAFSENQADSFRGGRIISLDNYNDDDNDNDTHIYFLVHIIPSFNR